VLDTPASITDGFILRNTCVSSTSMNRSILNKMVLSPLGNHDLQDVFLSKTHSISQGSNVVDAAT
jgi:hypothetical protein